MFLLLKPLTKAEDSTELIAGHVIGYFIRQFFTWQPHPLVVYRFNLTHLLHTIRFQTHNTFLFLELDFFFFPGVVLANCLWNTMEKYKVKKKKLQKSSKLQSVFIFPSQWWTGDYFPRKSVLIKKNICRIFFLP